MIGTLAFIQITSQIPRHCNKHSDISYGLPQDTQILEKLSLREVGQLHKITQLGNIVNCDDTHKQLVVFVDYKMNLYFRTL